MQGIVFILAFQSQFLLSLLAHVAAYHSFSLSLLYKHFTSLFFSQHAGDDVLLCVSFPTLIGPVGSQQQIISFPK